MVDLLMNSCADGSLVLACEHGHAQLADSLLEAGADKDGEWEYFGNLTPLLAACRNGHLSVTRLLVQSRTDPTKQFLHGAPPWSMLALEATRN